MGTREGYRVLLPGSEYEGYAFELSAGLLRCITDTTFQVWAPEDMTFTAVMQKREPGRRYPRHRFTSSELRELYREVSADALAREADIVSSFYSGPGYLCEVLRYYDDPRAMTDTRRDWVIMREGEPDLCYGLRYSPTLAHAVEAGSEDYKRIGSHRTTDKQFRMLGRWPVDLAQYAADRDAIIEALDALDNVRYQYKRFLTAPGFSDLRYRVPERMYADLDALRERARAAWREDFDAAREAVRKYVPTFDAGIELGHLARLYKDDPRGREALGSPPLAV